MNNLSKILVVTAAINHLSAKLQTLQVGMELIMPESFTIGAIDETLNDAIGGLELVFRDLCNQLDARDAFEDIDIQLISNALEILEPVAKVD